VALGASESRRCKPVAGQTSEWRMIRSQHFIVARPVGERRTSQNDPWLITTVGCRSPTSRIHE